MNIFKKIIQTTLLLLLIPMFAHSAGGKAYPSNQTETAQPIAAINSSGNQVVVHADASGNLVTVGSSGTIDYVGTVGTVNVVSSVGTLTSVTGVGTVTRVSSSGTVDYVTTVGSVTNVSSVGTVSAATLSAPVVASGNALSVDQSSTLESGSLSKASTGKLCVFMGRIDSTATSGTYYLQLLNASSAPPDGAVTMLATPLKVIHVNGADSIFNYDFLGPDSSSACVYASDGIYWDVSSTEFTKTISSAVVSATLLYQ